MKNKEFFEALEAWERESRIDREVFISSLEAGLSSAYKKETGDSRPAMIELKPEKHEIKVYVYRTVVAEVEDPDKEISLEEAKLVKKSYKVGDLVKEEISPKLFTRIAALTAKQVVTQRLTDAKKEQILEEMNDKEGEILPAVVRRIEGNIVYVEILSTQMEGVMNQQDQIARETYREGQTIRVYVKKLKVNNYGTQVLVSRSSPGFVRRLFELEVPEIKSGVVSIKKVVREAGNRTKIAVYSEDSDVDAVGACIGPKGTRIGAIVKELNGERIDVIQWSPNPLEFIASAISPAKAAFVQVNNEAYSASVYVNDDMLSLAIGREGQNARLAAKLTEWKIDVKPYSSCGILPNLEDEEI
ncbi:MAG: transcription termination/antitermination protein NusA [Clostridia bacterium]|nr:transcription termination/antitermination protein NusA [Clostridia bacterium]